MTTIVNGTGDGDNGLGVIVGVIVGILLIALFFIYALPALRGAPRENPAPSPAIKVEIPVPGNNNTGNTGNTGGTNTTGTSGTGAPTTGTQAQ